MYFLSVCAHMCAHVHLIYFVCIVEYLPWHLHEYQKTIFESQLSPSAMQSPGTKFKLEGLAGSTFTH